MTEKLPKDLQYEKVSYFKTTIFQIRHNIKVTVSKFSFFKYKNVSDITNLLKPFDVTHISTIFSETLGLKCLQICPGWTFSALSKVIRDLSTIIPKCSEVIPIQKQPNMRAEIQTHTH